MKESKHETALEKKLLSAVIFIFNIFIKYNFKNKIVDDLKQF